MGTDSGPALLAVGVLLIALSRALSAHSGPPPKGGASGLRGPCVAVFGGACCLVGTIALLGIELAVKGLWPIAAGLALFAESDRMAILHSREGGYAGPSMYYQAYVLIALALIIAGIVVLILG